MGAQRTRKKELCTPANFSVGNLMSGKQEQTINGFIEDLHRKRARRIFP